MPSLPLVLVLLVSMRGCAVEGRPRDVLTGQDFLAVFMRSHLRPTTDHYYSHNDVFNRHDLDPTAYQGETFKLADLEFEKTYEGAATTTTTTSSPVEETTEEGGMTTEEDVGTTTEESSQVVSVRVSSSVVRSGAEVRPALDEQDPITASAQRSHLGVDEDSSAVSFAAPKEEDVQEEEDQVRGVSYSEEHTVFRVEGRRVPDSLAAASQDYHVGPKDLSKGPEYPYSPRADPQKTPISYRTSVSTATSGSNVQFYREPPSFLRKPSPSPPPPPTPPPVSWQEPERVYGEPERNYEVDEAVSVGTDGRVHGPQDEPPAEQNHKLATVVEGADFRRYRVEQETGDGFIVGEYGVVNHNDGSTRGVRYTFARGVNRTLIFDALRKFLSL